MREKLGADRLPPHSSETEQAILGCILLDAQTCIPTCIEKLKGGAQAFYDLRHATIYETLIELWDDQVGIDVITLQERLRLWNKLEPCGGLSFISVLPDIVPSAANIEDYIFTVSSHYCMRQMIRVCTEVVARIYDGQDGDTDALLDGCERDVLLISESRVEPSDLSVPALLHSVINDIEAICSNPEALSGIQTGFTDLDKMTRGLQNGHMIVIAARPSMGKTSLLLNICEHIAISLNLPIGIVSMEMTGKQLINRMLCSRARVNIRNAQDGFLAERDYPKLTAAAGNIIHAPIHIDDKAGQSILEIRAKARRWKQQYDIKMLGIDYLQLANATGGKRRYESRQQEVTEISVGIKNLSKELGIPIVVLAQLNRDIERDKHRKPRLSDLRESGSIENDADLVGLLYKPQSFDGDENYEDLAVPINLLIAKNRDGQTGEVNLTFLKSYTRFESAAKVSDEDVQQHHEPQQQMSYAQTNQPYAD